MRVNGADSVTTAVLIGNTPEVNGNFYTYDAVSYTHLDVYKRQV